MRSPKTSRKKYVVVLRLSEASVPMKIEMARYYADKIENNPDLPDPQPTPDKVRKAALALEEAWLEAQTGNRLATRKMYAQESHLHTVLSTLGHYVQHVANASKTPDKVIVSAGMQYKDTKGRSANVFSVKHGKRKGTVKVSAPTVATRAVYQWEYRAKGDTIWKSAAVTTKASHEFAGLQPGKYYEFRQRTVTTKQEGNWTNAAELMAV